MKSGASYLSQSELPVTFGVGRRDRVDRVVINWPNGRTEEYANVEGFMNMMRIENYGGYENTAVPRLLGTIFNGNRCTNCEVAVRIGSGAVGTTILDTQLFGSPVLWSDWATTGTGARSRKRRASSPRSRC